MYLLSTEDALREKIKELTCLYEISKTISKSKSINIQTFYDIIISVKNAWRYCTENEVELHIKDYHLSTAEEIEQTISQSSMIIVNKTNYGHIKVHYPSKKYNLTDFSDDEQQLLDTIAIEIGNYVDKYQTLERKAALRQTIERMERLSLLGEMTAGIAHELNTPLGNILGFAELIKEQNSDPEISADISIIINSVIYSREIVKKLMFFSCEIPQKLELQELKPIIVFALSFLKSNFQKKAIRHELFFKDDTIAVRVDSVQITQVLFNLLINAIYASPEKSTIKIDAFGALVPIPTCERAEKVAKITNKGSNLFFITLIIMCFNYFLKSLQFKHLDLKVQSSSENRFIFARRSFKTYRLRYILKYLLNSKEETRY
ncbi:histidine kinase dimerization/phospho-acceptor domain-containing protein [Flavobacterium sp. LHD-85]|uniref:sensor histidine kinase n=1 Tax=Flavobacterium sp. LHD-85 TaxID=3071410 RepID=UPI0027DF2004|nr:histidine kinase dimerization/phospho-acceptor domain-containing protein [Flavobacterium sp. LHD-85]MDQ6530334.1 histidine kinase dimerization/phospho-acceptor domain-containing protein [Flavobacterium sp. LHD-85]